MNPTPVIAPARAGLGAEGSLFATLWAAHHDAVLAYARRRAPADVASEVVTSTFEVLWRRIDKPLDDPLPWLYAVARKQLANQRRGGERRRALLGLLGDGRGADVAPDTAGAAVDRSNARTALRQLRPADREILMLVAWEGLDPARAAAALGISEGAFTVRLHRARRRLQSQLADLNQEGAQS
jgi:RNA polymerase sigma-70 factor (ECF subfamily)